MCPLIRELSVLFFIDKNFQKRLFKIKYFLDSTIIKCVGQRFHCRLFIIYKFINQ